MQAFFLPVHYRLLRDAKLYEIGAVTEESPVLVTTNFSLTYYTVEGEVEASRIPAFICVIDTEGTSVLTAFAADKLTTDSIAAMLNSSKMADKIKHKTLLEGETRESLSGLTLRKLQKEKYVKKDSTRQDDD